MLVTFVTGGPAAARAPDAASARLTLNAAAYANSVFRSLTFLYLPTRGAAIGAADVRRKEPKRSAPGAHDRNRGFSLYFRSPLWGKFKAPRFDAEKAGTRRRPLRLGAFGWSVAVSSRTCVGPCGFGMTRVTRAGGTDGRRAESTAADADAPRRIRGGSGSDRSDAAVRGQRELDLGAHLRRGRRGGRVVRQAGTRTAVTTFRDRVNGERTSTRGSHRGRRAPGKSGRADARIRPADPFMTSLDQVSPEDAQSRAKPHESNGRARPRWRQRRTCPSIRLRHCHAHPHTHSTCR